MDVSVWSDLVFGYFGLIVSICKGVFGPNWRHPQGLFRSEPGLVHKIALVLIGRVRKKDDCGMSGLRFREGDSETTQHGNKPVAQRKYFAATMNAKTNEGAPFH